MARKFGSQQKRAGTGTVETPETGTDKWAGSVAAQVATAGQVKTILTKTVPVAYVLTDPNNPRQLAISQQQIIAIANRHPLDKTLLEEDNPQDWIEDYVLTVSEAETLTGKALGDFTALVSFAASLKSADRLMHPIVVRREESTFHVIAGERRLLAHILLNESHIAARISETSYQRKEIATLQWEENTQRIDMSLLERVEHVKKMLDNAEGISKTSVTKLSKMLGNSRAESQRYLVVLRYPTPLLMNAIKEGKVTELKTAAALAQLSPQELASKFAGTPKTEASKPTIKIQKKEHVESLGVLLKAAAKQLKLQEVIGDADFSSASGVSEAIESLLAAIEERSNG